MINAAELNKVLPGKLEKELDVIGARLVETAKESNNKYIKYYFQDKSLTIIEKNRIINYLAALGYKINTDELLMIGYEFVLIKW